MEQKINNEVSSKASNPLASSLNVKISMPEVFNIEMVEASQFKDYELWSTGASLMLNLFVGFIVATATNTVPERVALLWSISCIFLLLFVGAIILTLRYRKQISRGKQSIKMIASQE